MKKLLLLLLIPFLIGAAPTRQVDYTEGEIIYSADVESNENAVLNYLQAGVDTYADDSIKDPDIDWGTGTNQVSQDDVTDGATYKQYNPASVAITGGTITGITDLAVADGGTGASTLSDGFVLLGNGTSAIQTLDVTGNGSIIIGDGTTDPTTLSAFTSSTGTLKHEYGGLEADISGYTNGLYGQLSNATADIDTSSELASAISDETGTGNLVFSVSPTFTGTITMASLNASDTVTGIIVAATTALFTDYIRPDTDGVTALQITDNLGGNVLMNIDTTNNRIGIGTTGPARLLHVYAGSSGATPAANTELVIEDDSDAELAFVSPNTNDARLLFGDPQDDNIGGIIYQHSDNSMLFRVNDGTKAIIDSSGNIGIGTTVPTQRFHIKSAGADTSPLLIWQADEDVLAQIKETSGRGLFEMRTAVNAITVNIDTGGNSYFNGGNVGIGTTGPDALLEVGDGTNSTLISSAGAITQSGSATLTLQDGSDMIITANANAAPFLANSGDTGTGVFDFGGATSFELPNGADPTTDATGETVWDTTDNTLDVYDGAVSVVAGKKIKSWACTLAFPDLLQAEIDQWMFKDIGATEFPNGVVITEIYIATSASSTYAVNVENWDSPTVINATNPTIDAITTSTSTETTETTITYATIAAGQIIMLDLPTTDIGWTYIRVSYYEPVI